MAYTKTQWANGQAPAISATNLNKIENELESLDTGLSNKLDVNKVVNQHSSSETDVYSANQTNVEIGNAVKEVYSTSEVKTNKVYIDSNNVEHTIYRKMIPITDNGTYNEGGKRFTWTNSGISNLSQVFDLFCVINYSNRALTSSCSEVDIYYLNDKRLQLAIATNYTAGSSGYVIIEYTKTTEEEEE